MYKIWLSPIFLFVLLLSSCGDSPQNNPADKVKVQLKYTHQAQFAGLYVAQEKGFFAEENLDVEFIEGGRGVELVTPVINGTAQFGIASSDLILAKRVEGLAIKAIAAIYRRSAVIFVAKAESGIVRPHDLVGKRVAVISNSTKEYEFQLRAMLSKLNLNIADIELVNLDYQFKGFLSGKIDATGSYTTGGAIRLKAQEENLNYIWPSDYGIDFYSDTIFVSDALIESNSNLILRFLRAALKGWNEAIRNTEEAIDITMRYAKIKDKKMQTAMMEAQQSLVYTGEDQIGWMEEKVWAGMSRIMLEQGVIDQPLDDINSLYSMKFLQEIYPDN